MAQSWLRIKHKKYNIDFFDALLIKLKPHNYYSSDLYATVLQNRII
jgi:hypothetical protein